MTVLSREAPLVSVVIPTYNSDSTISKCLESLASSTYPNLETVVIDNNSTDHTVPIAREFGAKVLESQALRSAARNVGIREARGDFLLFLDSDMIPSSPVISDCVSLAMTKGVDAIMIPEMRKGEGFWAKCREIERQMYVGDPLIESVRFVRRSSLEKIGGFDESLEAGEDWDFHARIEESGARISSVRSVIIHEEGRRTLRDMATKRYYYGKTLRKYISKQSGRAVKQLVPFRPNLIRNRKVLWRNPLYGAGILLMKTVEWYTTALSIIVSALP